jgi:carbamoyl-phosphate synthase large subunit
VPLVSKVANLNMAALATKIMLGATLADLGLAQREIPYHGVKEAVFPFPMFPEVDPLLGPEMRSTGEVLGLATGSGLAFFKSQEAAGARLPTSGTVLMTIAERDRVTSATPGAGSKQGDKVLRAARLFAQCGFRLVATVGTAKFLAEHGITVETALKLHEGRPNIADLVENGAVQLVINTPAGTSSEFDDSYIRKAAIRMRIPYMTTIAATLATAEGIAAYQAGQEEVRSLQEYHASIDG